jgi:hypothetical protein
MITLFYIYGADLENVNSDNTKEVPFNMEKFFQKFLGLASSIASRYTQRDLYAN